MPRVSVVRRTHNRRLCTAALLLAWVAPLAQAELPDNTKATNNVGAGINKSLSQQIGAGRGDVMTPDSSAFIIARDPFRAIRRGRQLFQRKFTRAEGQGPSIGDGVGDLNTNIGIGAGLGDSCATCHGRPRGAAGFGGDVATRPDSRDAPHLFGLGLKEMLADEITTDLRAIRAAAITEAASRRVSVTRTLASKGINYGSITAQPNGTVDTSRVVGVNADLRVRPFFADGAVFSIREFAVGAFAAEMGLQSVDSDFAAVGNGARVVTPSGMVLEPSQDSFVAPVLMAPHAASDPDGDGVVNEMQTSLLDFMEFYLLNYFKPGTYQQTMSTSMGRSTFLAIGCGSCHIPDLTINRDRRVADVETAYDSSRGIFNTLFTTATTLHNTTNDGSGFPALKTPRYGSFVVRNLFTDFKRHDLGPNFWERNWDGSIQKQFLTTPLWGVGSTPPYGHDGRSINLNDVILRHGGEAQAARDAYARLFPTFRAQVLDFLNSLVLFPPDDTASNLDPGDRNAPNFPQSGHGSIKLTVLFNDPTDLE
jgi:mono/diheme cytochrome c family protein